VTRPAPVWHGSERALIELTRSITHHCTCPPRPAGPAICGAHRLLLDQRALDGLLFARRLLPRLRAEERGWMALRGRADRGAGGTAAQA
jgi:hypothetical protein